MANAYELMGGSEKVRAVVETFYEEMFRNEPALTKLHRLDPDGRVAKPMREKVALYLIGWMGGPQDYVAQNGHPRLRMRHFHVKVDKAMSEAWMRSMKSAFEKHQVTGEVRAFLEEKLTALADHMRNVEEP
jgi:hemoglobin